MDVVIDDASPGDVHVHRDRILDEAKIFIRQVDNTWDDCTLRWCRQVQDPPRHPQAHELILDALGSSGVPAYISERTYKERPGGRRGLLIEKSH